MVGTYPFFVQNKEGGEKRNHYIVFCFLLIFLLHVGVNPDFIDLKGYSTGYAEFHKMSFAQVIDHNSPSLKAEIGWRVMCKFLTYLCPSFFFLLIFVTLLMLSGYYVTVKKYSPMWLLSILLIMVGPFYQSLFVLRQHLAMGIILLSYPHIIKRDWKLSFLYLVFATSIHTTALVFTPVYFLYGMKPRNIVVAVMAIFVTVLGSLSLLFQSIANLELSGVSYGDYYLEESEEGSNAKMAGFISAILFLRVCLLRKDLFKNGPTRLISILCILATLFCWTGIGFIASPRLFMYYTSTLFLILPNTLVYIKQHFIRNVIGAFFFFFLLYFFLSLDHDPINSELWFFYK